MCYDTGNLHHYVYHGSNEHPRWVDEVRAHLRECRRCQDEVDRISRERSAKIDRMFEESKKESRKRKK